jgi:DNA-binding protein HU-beta
MNKTQLVEALAEKLGDKRTAASAVDGVLDIITQTVGSGGSVTLTGFGVFEARARAPRVARNPRTGETVPVPATTVPAFRPGTAFKSTVSGAASAPAEKTPAKKAPARRGTTTRGTTSRTTAARPAARSARATGSFSEEKTATKTAAKPADKKQAAEKPAAAKKPTAKKAAAEKPAKKAAKKK